MVSVPVPVATLALVPALPPNVKFVMNCETTPDIEIVAVPLVGLMLSEGLFVPKTLLAPSCNVPVFRLIEVPLVNVDAAFNANIPVPILEMVRAEPPSLIAPRVSVVVALAPGITLKVGLPDNVTALKVSPSAPLLTLADVLSVSCCEPIDSEPSVCVTPAPVLVRLSVIVPPLDCILRPAVKESAVSFRSSKARPPNVTVSEELPKAPAADVATRLP